MRSPSTTANYKQAAAAELAKAIGHLEACLHFWSPSSGLTPAEERASEEVIAWQKLNYLTNAVKALSEDDGPGA